MSVKVENLEKNMAKLTVTVDAKEFDQSLVNSYNKNKNRFSIPGFRKGKVPMAMVEKMYGEQVLYDDALNEILDKTYPDAVKESGLDVVSRPEIGIDEIGKGKDLVYTATVAVKPEVTLGEYKGVTVEKADVTVTEAEVQDRLNKELDKQARMRTESYSNLAKHFEKLESELNIDSNKITEETARSWTSSTG